MMRHRRLSNFDRRLIHGLICGTVVLAALAAIGSAAHAQEPAKPAAAPAASAPAASATGSAPAVQLKLNPLGGPMTELPRGKEPAADDTLGQLLYSAGIDDLLLGKFVDGRPLELRATERPERAPLIGLFSSLKQIRVADADAVTLSAQQPSALSTSEARGKFWRLEGRLKSVTIEQLTDDEIDRLYADVLYTIKEDPPRLPADDVRRFFFRSEVSFGDRTVVVVSLRMPDLLLAKIREASKQPMKAGDTYPVDERVTIHGLLLKNLGEQSDARPLIATTRPAWHPDTPLGKLGMDYGLYDDVRLNSTDLSKEHECFFQLLASMKRAKLDDLLKLTDENYSVVPLFNKAESMHGKFVALNGVARRATYVSVPYHEVLRRFGIDHYYEVAIFTADSQDNPLIFALLELPQGFPQGDDIHVEVRIPGTFLTGFYYGREATTKEAAKDANASGNQPPPDRNQKAPLLIGKSLYRYPSEAAKQTSFDWYVTGLVGLGALALVVVTWASMRSDRRTRKVMEKTNAPAPGTSLNDLPGDFRSGPDFSNLDPK